MINRRIKLKSQGKEISKQIPWTMSYETLKWSEIVVLQFGVENKKKNAKSEPQWQAKKSGTVRWHRHEFLHSFALFVPTTIYGYMSHMCSSLRTVYNVQCIEIAVGNCVNITWKFLRNTNDQYYYEKWHVMKTLIELLFKIEHTVFD